MSVAMEQMETSHEVDELAADTAPASLPEALKAAGREPAAAVTVDIYDQTYRLHGQDPAYIATLAEIVDGKMRAVAAGGTTVDSLRVAVLAALNIADELTRVQAKYQELNGSLSHTEGTLRDRADNLSGLLDSILDERKIG